MKLHTLITLFAACLLLDVYAITNEKSTEVTVQPSESITKPKEVSENVYRDIFPDTWVATDALGRTMPDESIVGGVKTNQRRVVGMFYITWHDDGKNTRSPAPYSSDVTKILEKDP